VQRIEAIETLILKVLRLTTLYADEHLTADVIVNPCAGSLSSDERCEKTILRLRALTEGLAGPFRDDDTLSVRFHRTHYVGHAREISTALLSENVAGKRIVISLGGDGTHGEVLSAYHGQNETRFMRFPLGTGNDGAESRDLGKTVGALLGNGVEAFDGSVEVSPSGMSVIRGFNIASIGLDAYVAYLTNRLKGKLGGDLYKVIADVTTLFYERIVGALPMQVTTIGADRSETRHSGRFLICAVGASGHREYGGGKRVLPGEENVCLIDRVGLLGKIRLKSLFYRAKHPGEPNVTMARASTVVVDYEGRVPLQVDGEITWLRRDNFPVRFTVQEPRIPVVRPVRR
jgi:diacylglycerol kinase family enzyme